MTEPTNVNADEVRRSLDGRLRLGRLPAEAAGEERWITGLQRGEQVLSDETRDEINQVVDAWLKENVGAYAFWGASLMAKRYAQFLAERVDLAVPVNQAVAIHDAWREWRQR